VRGRVEPEIDEVPEVVIGLAPGREDRADAAVEGLDKRGDYRLITSTKLASAGDPA